jgi:hypothetical protein
MGTSRRWSPTAIAAIAWQLADPLAILGFVLLAALGRLPARDVVYAVLAVLAGRLTPRGPTLPPGSPSSSTMSSGPSSRRGPPSGVLSALAFVHLVGVHLVELARRAWQTLHGPPYRPELHQNR